MKTETIQQILIRYGVKEQDIAPLISDISEELVLDVDKQWLVQNDHMRGVIKDLIAPKVLSRWLAKNLDYRGQQMFLGVSAQFIDINRKFWKLKHILWDGHKPDFESAEEIMFDMIGHLLMAIYFQRHPNEWDEFSRG